MLEVCLPINPGWEYNTVKKIMEFSPTKAETDKDQPAVWTAKVLQSIANSIEQCIQLTFDTPDMNENGRMPVLDLEIWTEDNTI